MSEILVGDVLARLRMDVSQFNQAIADVLQRLQQLNQVSTQTTTQQGQGQQSTNQLATAYVALAQSIAQQTQAYTQASQATLAYRQAQDQTRQAAQATAQTMRTEAATALQAQRAAAQAATQVAAQTHAQQLQDARAAAQAQLQVTKQLHAEQMQSARLAAQAQLQEARDAAAAARQASQGGTGGGLFEQMLGVAGGIGIATSIQAIVGQLKDFAVSTVETGARLEQLRASFNAISGDARTGAQQFQFVIDTSMKLGLELEGAARGFRSIAGATRGTSISAAETRDIFLGVAQATRVMGGSQQEFERALLAIGQIISKGTVQMEELRGQLAEAIPGAVQIAARAIGVTTEKLNEMVASGETKAIPFVKAFARQLREEFAGEASKAADTTAAAFARLQTQLGLLKEFLFNSGIGAMLKSMAEEGAKALKVVTDLDAARRLQEQEEKAAARVGTGGLKERQVTAEQTEERRLLQRQLTEARRQLAELDKAEAQGGVAGAFAAANIPPRARLEEFIAEKAAREEALIVEMKQTAAVKDAEEERTKAAKARRFEQEQESKALTELQEKLKTLQGIRDQQTKGTMLAPDYFGKAGGTSEQQITAAKELNKEYAKVLDSLRDIVRGLPKESVARLLTNFPEVAKDVQNLNKEWAAGEKLQDDLKEKTKASEKAARDLAAEQKRAVTEALQLDATLERLQGMTRRPDENKAEEAATRARSQYAAAIAEGEKAIVELERSASLRKARPEALEQYKAVVTALREASKEQAKLASEEVLKQQIKPLEALALKYGLVTTEITSQSGRVQELASKYGIATKEAIDLYEAEKLAASFKGTTRQEEADKYLETIQKTIAARQAIEAKVPVLEQEARASFESGRAAVAAVPVTSDLERQLELLRTPREERVSTRARQKAERASGGVLTEEQEALIRQIEAQERVNKITQMAEQIGDQAAQTITTGLLKIVDGTERVGEGFKNMAKAILDSIAEITLNETFKTLIRFGLGLATTALTGALTPAATESGPSTLGPSSSFIGSTLGSQFQLEGFQHGGVVSRPTHALLGENPGMNPEYVVNTPQMKALMASAMRAAPQAGGQSVGGDVSVILVDNRGQAEREAAAQRGMGRQVIIQEVVRDLSQGSGSTIGRMIKAGGH